MKALQRIPMSEYLASPAVSRSDLIRIHERTPFYYRWHKKNSVDNATKATQYGSALHEAVFEPKEFDGKWTGYSGSRTRSRNKDGETVPSGKYKAWLEEAGYDHEFVLGADEFAMIADTSKLIRSLPGPSYLLESGQAEQTVFWTDTETGIECRARFDFIDLERGLAVDLKSTADITPDGFGKSCANFGYALQAVHYMDAMRALNGEEMVNWEAGEEIPKFYFLAVTKELPIEVALYELVMEDLQKAAKIRRSALRKIRECTDAKEWPGLPNTIQPLVLPKWWGNSVA